MILSNRSSSPINTRRLAVLLASTMLAASPAAAATYNVTDEASLVAAINAANANAGADTIIFDNGFAISGTLPVITDITTIDTGAFILTAPNVDVFTFSGNGSVQLAGGGLIGGNRTIVTTGTAVFSVDNAAGGTISGNSVALQSTSTGTTTIDNAGDIVGGIVSTGGGDLVIDNVASGNIVRVPFGSAIDMSNGGAITLTNAGDVVGSGWGVVGRDAADSIVNSGRIASGTISGETITASGANGIEFQAGGTITNLSGGQIIGNGNAITGGAVVLDNQAGASISGTFTGVNLSGAAQVTNAGSITGGTGSFDSAVRLNSAGATLDNLAGGTIAAGRGVSMFGNGVVTNAGTITSNCAAPSFQCAAVIMFAGGTVANEATGLITSSARTVAGQGTITNVINSGSIVSTSSNDVAVILFAGGTITNNAGGSITNTNGYATYFFGTAGTLDNAGTVAGRWAVSADGGATGTILNSGTITGGTFGVGTFGNSSILLTNSGTITASAGNAVDINTGTVTNQVGGLISTNGHAVRLGGAGTVINSGTLASTASDGVWSSGNLNLTNSGTINGGFAGVTATAGGTIVNSGTINGSGTASGFSYAIQIGAAGAITNQSGGQLNGADGAIAVAGSGAVSIDLQAGSAANGAIVSTGDGARSVTINGLLASDYNASTGTGIDTVTLGTTGSMSNAHLGGGDDSFTTYGGAISGQLDGGDGIDRLTADLASGVSSFLDLADVAAFESIEKLGLGSLTLTGTSASPDATIFAGNGYNDDGLLVFDGTAGLTGAIFVNGAVIRANTAGAFGTGTITMIDPTIQFAASGTYANDIVLASVDPVGDPSRFEAINSATATLTGSVTEAGMGQPLVIGGNGTVVLTNTANAWTGSTTIEGGATLQGASNTISGSSIVVDGALNYVQAASGSVAQNISGAGRIGVSGLGAGETLTFAGNLTNGGINLTDGSSIALGGAANETSGDAVFVSGNDASVSILNGASVISNGDQGILSLGSNTSIVNQGSLTGANFIGVALYGGGSIVNGSATNAAALIEGGNTGSFNGGATVSVDNYGVIRGLNFDGIGGGDLTITNRSTGQIIGQGNASQFNSFGIVASGTLTLDNMGQIVGRLAGVRSEGVIDVTNSGLIGSGYLSGTTFSYSDGNDGIQALGGGTIDNLAGGQILGSISGIYTANAPLTVTNAGTIHGNQYGIYSDAALNLTNLAGGSVDGGNVGLQLNANANVLTNSGSITGQNAIYSNGSVSLINLSGGSITGVDSAFHLAGTGAGTITNFGDFTNGVVSTGGGNLSIDNRASGNIVRVVFGSAIDMSNGGALTLTNAGDIVGSGWGIVGRNAADSITNSGRIASGTISGETITVGGNNAIQLDQGGSVTNLAGGRISGNVYGVISYNTLILDNRSGASITSNIEAVTSTGANSIVTNSGSIASGADANDHGVYLLGANSTVTNNVGGTITGTRAVRFDATGATLTNRGTITGTSSGVLATAGTLSVTNSGTISASNGAGVFAGSNVLVDNQAGGLITASSQAVFAGGNATITNAGTLTATNADGLGIGGTLTLTNSGVINGGFAGVTTNGGGSIVNSGAINGSGTASGFSYAVQFTGAGSITNLSGGQLNGADGAIALYGNGPVSIDLQAGSSANGAIVARGDSNRSLTVDGLLTGAYNASAVAGIDAVLLGATGSMASAHLGAGADSFTTNGGAIGGAVTGGADLDVLTYDIAGTASYDAGLFAEFETRSKIGAGTLTLTGTDAMTSDFAVDGGTLVLSGGTALNDMAALVTASGTTTRIVAGNEQVRTISGAGAIDLGANALILGGNDSSTYSGIISGSGSLAKFGTGILTLTGSNSYTGLTQISGGTLRLGANDVIANASTVLVASGATFDLAGFNETIGGLTGAGTVALGAGRLTVDQSANTLFSGVITGTGGLTKAGTGLLDLTGTSTYTGATFVNGGILAVNGSLLSAVTVNNGGTLRGTGTVGGLSVLSGGILAPGNSIGTMNVAGNLSFAAGSTYQVEVTPTAADRTNASGNITISGGTVQVLASGTAYNPLTRYTILNAGGTVSGTFANVTSNLAFLTPGLEYDPRNVVLVLRRNDIDFTDVAENPNQFGVAAAVQSLGISPLYDAVLVQSASGARAAYDALSGEIYASTATAILARGDRLQDAMASNQPRTDGIALWADAGRSWGTYDASSSRGSALAKTDSEDLFAGFNWRRGSIGATLAGGRMIDKVQIDARLSDAKVRSWLLGGQLAYGEDLGLRAVAGGHYAWHQVDTDRGIIFPGFAETASSDRDGRGYHLFAQVGHASVTHGITLEPFAGLQHDRVKLDSLQEDGGLAALDVSSSSHSLTTAQLGLKIATTANLGWAAFTPRASVAFQHLMGDRTGSMQAGFLSGGIDFDVAGATLARNSAKVGLDLDFDFGGAKLVAGYNGTIGGVSDEHTAKVALQVRF